MVKFDPLLVNVKESSVAPSVSADAEPAASEDMQHFESTLVPLPQTGYKGQQSQIQQPARPKTSQSDKRPKKKVTKADDNAHNKSWDSDHSTQVPAIFQIPPVLQYAIYRTKLIVCVIVQMEFELPVRLKQILLDEYDGLAGHEELPSLPYKPCVADILSQYVEESNSEGLAFEAEV